MSTAAIQKLADPVRVLPGAGPGAGEIRYRTWAPPESPIEIEYADELIREVRLTSLLGNATGVLYGSRHGNWIRLVAARRVLSNGGFESDPDRLLITNNLLMLDASQEPLKPLKPL